MQSCTNNRFNAFNSVPKKSTTKKSRIPAPTGAWAKPLKITPEPPKASEKPAEQSPKALKPQILKRKAKIPQPTITVSDVSDDSGIEEYDDMYEDLTEPW